MSNTEQPKIGATALLLRSKDKKQQILTIDCTKGRGLILPGGKFEAGKDYTYEQAAARELYEETNLLATSIGEWVFGNINTDGYFVNTFRYHKWDHSGIIELPDGSFAGTSWTEGRPQWVDLITFVGYRSQFWPYYELMLKAARVIL